MSRTIAIWLTIEGPDADEAEGTIDRMLDAGSIQDAVKEMWQDCGIDAEIVDASCTDETECGDEFAGEGSPRCGECGGRGWSVFEVDDGRFQVQRDDACSCAKEKGWTHDDDAWPDACSKGLPIDSEGYLPNDWTWQQIVAAQKAATQ